MRIGKRNALGMLALVSTLAACGDFLSGTGLGDDDPNNPTVGARDQAFVAVQVRQFIQLEGNLARTAGIWTQQFAGVGQQYIPLGQYNFGGGFFNGDFNNFYISGGLIDQRQVIADSEAAGDRLYAGIAKVHHALSFGTAASLWGDLPYSEAVRGIGSPRLDPQAEVYDSVQRYLDEAIADLQATPVGINPGTLDMVYGGNAAQWLEAAHTLKARFHLHWAAIDAGRYALARAAAQNGISTPDNNFRTLHSDAAGTENIWHQFQRQRSGYMLAGQYLVNLLRERNDPRLALYFAPDANGGYSGAAPGEAGSGFSNLSAVRQAPEFRQPLITYAENQLILAETNYRLGEEGAARTHLNNARSAAGLGPSPVGGGEALLREILTEKYIALFQNIEVYNLYKRTCWPPITPVAGRRVPGRLYYSDQERNANQNMPGVTDPAYQRNPNDPGTCTASVIGGA